MKFNVSLFEGLYTERVLEAIRLLSDRVMPNFAMKVEGAVGNMSAEKEVDQNEFIDATRLVYDGVSGFLRPKYRLSTDLSTNVWPYFKVNTV